MLLQALPIDFAWSRSQIAVAIGRAPDPPVEGLFIFLDKGESYILHLTSEVAEFISKRGMLKWFFQPNFNAPSFQGTLRFQRVGNAQRLELHSIKASRRVHVALMGYSLVQNDHVVSVMFAWTGGDAIVGSKSTVKRRMFWRYKLSTLPFREETLNHSSAIGTKT